jgi:hypothetical protein
MMELLSTAPSPPTGPQKYSAAQFQRDILTLVVSARRMNDSKQGNQWIFHKVRLQSSGMVNFCITNGSGCHPA